jgi:hypothetical protein
MIVGNAPLTSLMNVDHANPQADGTITLSRADGKVMSVQANGSIEWRPAGTAGPFEKAQVYGSMVVFNVQGQVGSAPHVFAYFP